jgi:hypothetical protein
MAFLGQPRQNPKAWRADGRRRQTISHAKSGSAISVLNAKDEDERMLITNFLNTRTIGVIAVLALTGFAIAQEATKSTENFSKHQYTQASLEGNYGITGIYGAHAAGFVGTTDISREGVVSNSSGTFVDLTLPAPVELSPITGQVTVNPDGTGLFTLDVTFVGGPAHVPFHLSYVITDARIERKKLIATRIVALQHESSNVPDAEFATLTLTRRPE